MGHIPTIIEDLNLILISAGLVILLFKKFKQPIVLGYLIAGILVSQYIPFFPTVKDPENIKIWGEIGVIFLLFGLGLEFSFKKLAAVGRPAGITAVFEVLFMLGVGFLTGQALNWSKMDSLFLGGILSVSSTTIIVKAFQGLGFKGRRFVSMVFGVLVVEDLIAILLLVLLSTMAVTQSLSGTNLMVTTLRLGFFMVLWFVVGIYALPLFLNRVRKLLDDETTLVMAVGLCLLMVSLTTTVGFSPALGAFVMGSILAETREGKRIEHVMIPVKDLFAAVFFVSVGMQINPKILMDDLGVVLLITVVTIVGKFVSSMLGSLISGKDFKQSVQTGLSLAQIGEFSFIIATLGVNLGVTSDFLYPIAIAVSGVTTFTTPYQIQYSAKVAQWLESKIPAPILLRLQNYESALSAKGKDNVLSLIWRGYGPKLILNSVVILAIAIGLGRFALEVMDDVFVKTTWLHLLSCVVTLILCAPFLWAILMGGPAQLGAIDPVSKRQLEKLQFGIFLVRGLIVIFLATFIVGRFFPVQSFASYILVSLSILALFFTRYAEPLYSRFENVFLANLNVTSVPTTEDATPLEDLAPWDATLAEFTVAPNSALVGQSLLEAKLRENFGVMITMIERGDQKILAPGRYEALYPFDKVFLIGTDDQLAHVGQVFESVPHHIEDDQTEIFGLESIILPQKSQFAGKSIRECGIRETVNGIIVGIERHDQRILNPNSDFTLQIGDVVWLVGNRSKIRKLKQKKEDQSAASQNV